MQEEIQMCVPLPLALATKVFTYDYQASAIYAGLIKMFALQRERITRVSERVSCWRQGSRLVPATHSLSQFSRMESWRVTRLSHSLPVTPAVVLCHPQTMVQLHSSPSPMMTVHVSDNSFQCYFSDS